MIQFISKLSSSFATAGSIILSLIWLANVMFRGMRRIPRIIWILLIPMLVILARAVSELPDIAVNIAIFPTGPVVAAMTAADATATLVSMANQPAENTVRAAKAKRTYKPIQRKNDRLTIRHKK